MVRPQRAYDTEQLRFLRKRRLIACVRAYSVVFFASRIGQIGGKIISLRARSLLISSRTKYGLLLVSGAQGREFSRIVKPCYILATLLWREYSQIAVSTLIF